MNASSSPASDLVEIGAGGPGRAGRGERVAAAAAGRLEDRGAVDASPSPRAPPRRRARPPPPPSASSPSAASSSAVLGELGLAVLLLVLGVQPGEGGGGDDQGRERRRGSREHGLRGREPLPAQADPGDQHRGDDEAEPEDVEQGFVHAAGILDAASRQRVLRARWRRRWPGSRGSR